MYDTNTCIKWDFTKLDIANEDSNNALFCGLSETSSTSYHLPPFIGFK